MIRAILNSFTQKEPSTDPLTALRNENEARLMVERNSTRRGEIFAEQKRLTTAALRRGL